MLQIINRLQGQKFNPHHDKLGKFASGGTGGAGVIPEGGPLEADFVGEFTGPLFHGTTVEGAGEITKKGMKPSKLGITEEVFLGTSRNRVRFYENGGLVVYHVNKLNIVSNAHATDAAREIYDNKHDAFHAKLHKVGPSSPEAQRLYAFEERGGIQRQVRHELVRRGIDAYTQGSDTIVVLNLEKLGTPKVFTGDVLATKEFAQKSLTDIPDDKKFWQEIRQQVTKEIQPLFLELMLAGVEFATEAVNLMRKKASGQKYNPYHDRLGKFASGGAGGGGSVSNLSSDQQDSMVTAWLFYDGCQPVQKSSRGILDNKFNPKSMADRKAAFMLENIENGVVQPSVHRGIRVDSKGLAALQPGSAFTLPLSSFSKDPAIAKKFATKELFEKRPGNPVVVTIKNCKGYDISQTTAAKKLGFAPQKEVVMAGKFNIASRTQRGGITYLELAMQ